MKRRFSLFTYPVMDMKAAEAALNRRAEQGWRLERVWLGVLAVFVPAHVPVRYCLDWCDNVKDMEWADYLALLPLWGLGGLVWLGRMALRLRQWRRAAEEGEPTPVPGRWSGLAGALLALAGWLSVLVLLAALAWDVIAGCLPMATVLVMILVGAVWRVKAALGARLGAGLRRMAALAFLLAAVSAGGRLVFGEAAAAARLAPPLEAGHLFPGVTEVVLYHRTASTALLSCTDWDESGPADDGPLRTRETPLGTRFDVGTRCTAWRARWPWLAEGTAALLRGGLEPAEGLDHVWHGRAGERQVWLLQQDDLILRVSTELTLDGDWPRRALALLEEEDGT